MSKEMPDFLQEAIKAHYAASGLVTRWVLTAEVATPENGKILSHLSADINGDGLAPWDEASLHNSGRVLAEDDLRGNSYKGGGDDE
jgi:hypothetical protein